IDDGSVLASERRIAVFAAGVGETAAVEDKAAAVAGVVLRQALVKRETEDADDEMVGFRGDAVQLLGREHGLEGTEECGKSDRQLDIVQEPTEIFERKGDGLEKVGFAFVEAAETVGAERLHDTDVNVGVVVPEEGFAIDGDVGFESAKVVVEKVLAKGGRKVGFGVKEQR